MPDETADRTARDQHTQQDPRTQYPLPDAQTEQQQAHPGDTDRMGPAPDHGEDTYRGSGRLADRAAIVTGGDSGIGRAVVLAYAREGADVLISCLPEEADDAAESARLVEDAGRRAVVVTGDIRSEEHCQEIVDRAVAEFGRVDVLVSNAAYQMSNDDGVTALTTEQFDRVFKTNVYAMFWLVRAAVPHMRPGSAIITTASIQAQQPSPELLDYAATKGAIVTFTKALAKDVIGKGIRANAVAPGPVWTPLIPATMPPEKVGDFGAQTPLGRASQPAELAPAYVFLASQESSSVVGEVIAVTGGQPFS